MDAASIAEARTWIQATWAESKLPLRVATVLERALEALAGNSAQTARCCERDHDGDGNCDRHPIGTVTRLEQYISILTENDRKALEQLARALGWKDGGPGWTAAIAAVAAKGNRIQELGQHISGLEKSLEDGRKEREEAMADRDRHAQNAEVWRKRVHDASEALSDVLPGEVGRLDMLARIAGLKRQRDEAMKRESDLSFALEDMRRQRDALKPSGQVAEDVEELRAWFSGGYPGDVRPLAALSRLAAKAQAADNAKELAARIRELETEASGHEHETARLRE